METDKTARIPVGEQPKDRYYEMSIRFAGDAVLPEVDDVLRAMGVEGGAPSLDNAGTLRIVQCVPFIPDDETLGRYAGILEDAQRASNGPVRLANVRFAGYDYIYPVTAPETGKKSDGDDGKEAGAT